MRRLILTTASVLALGSAGLAHAQGYSTQQGGASANMPPTQMQQTHSPSASATRTSATKVSKDEVKQAQQALREQGLYRGRIDGVLGPKTKTALRNFQRKNGLPATASLDRRTMESLSGGGTQGQGSSMPSSSGKTSAAPMMPPNGQIGQPGNAGAENGAATGGGSTAGEGPGTGAQPSPHK